jgi:hypothetical protein
MVSKKPGTEKGLVRTVFYQPPEDRDAMAELAHQRRDSESELYRQAVREFLDRQSRQK